MNFRLEELGSMRQMAEAEKNALLQSSWYAMKRLGEEVKTAVRADVRGSGVKRAARLAGAWRGRTFPNRPGELKSGRVVYVLGNNAPNVLDTFEEAGVITAKGGALLIPVGRVRNIKLRIGQPKTDLPAEALKMFGASRFVVRRMRRTNELALGVIAADANGKKRFVPCFVMRKSVRRPHLFQAKKILAQMSAAMPSRHADETFREMEKRYYGAHRSIWRTTVRDGRINDPEALSNSVGETSHDWLTSQFER